MNQEIPIEILQNEPIIIIDEIVAPRAKRGRKPSTTHYILKEE